MIGGIATSGAPDQGDSGRLGLVILIVEDESLVRLWTATALEEAGFSVLQAANADEAIEILEKRSDISVVFTDVHMPGSMDGVKLAHAVRNRWPPIRIIVTSGRDAIEAGELPKHGRFFGKPYDLMQIKSVLREWAV